MLIVQWRFRITMGGELMGVKYSITYGSQTKEITDAQNNSFTLNYVGVKSESLSAGSGKTLSCANKQMYGNLNVGTHNIACSGKIMRNDVVVTSQSFVTNITMTFTGSGGSSKVYVSLLGLDYMGAATVTIPAGTVLVIHVFKSGFSGTGVININGTQIASGSKVVYNFYPEGDCTIALSAPLLGSGSVSITTSSPWHGNLA